MIRPEASTTTAYAQKRASWEATVRAARAGRVSVTVQGWTQADGTLWPVNRLVRVRAPRLAIDADLLIAEATYTLSEGAGTRTTLALRRRDAFLPEPVVAKAAGNEFWRTAFDD
jgi:prophage tail gpP-like protein